MVVGDFNEDGWADLAIANSSGNTVTVLLNNQTGGFTAATGSPFTVGTKPVSIAMIDLNDDGKLDLMIANSGSNNLSVLLGDGAGHFSAATGSPFAAGTQPTSVAIGFFEGTVTGDVAVTDSNGFVTLLSWNGTGFTPLSSSPVAAGSSPSSVVAFGFGVAQDLAIANLNTNTVTVLLNNGTGHFAPSSGSPFPTGSQPYSIVEADFNQDGIPDVAIANNGDNTVSVLLGDGTGNFAPSPGSPFPAGPAPTSVATADFNGDTIRTSPSRMPVAP